jgi:DNA-binding NtrC family response regulator
LLLRFLETGEVQTVGGNAHLASHVDVRVIAATNRDLAQAAAAGSFREDLFYRLNVLHFRIPPLRERPSDIPLLAAHYLAVLTEQHRMPMPTLSSSALDRLTTYGWPGNVRELRNVIERLVVQATGGVIEPHHLPSEISAIRSSVAEPSHDRPSRLPEARVEALLHRLLVQRESFWTSVYQMFEARDLTRDELRSIIRTGLERTHGSYRQLVGLFNMPVADYKRFLRVLYQHDCHLPFHTFRTVGIELRHIEPCDQVIAGSGRARRQ